jgi:hypothetical protein
MSSSALVVIRTFLTSIDAELARSALEAADIPSTIRADDAGGMRPHLSMGGVELLINVEDAQRAREILDAD